MSKVVKEFLHKEEKELRKARELANSLEREGRRPRDLCKRLRVKNPQSPFSREGRRASSVSKMQGGNHFSLLSRLGFTGFYYGKG